MWTNWTTTPNCNRLFLTKCFCLANLHRIKLQRKRQSAFADFNWFLFAVWRRHSIETISISATIADRAYRIDQSCRLVFAFRLVQTKKIAIETLSFISCRSPAWKQLALRCVYLGREATRRNQNLTSSTTFKGYIESVANFSCCCLSSLRKNCFW